MSVRIMAAVWLVKLPDSDKLVLLALADCANDEGGCWPSMATLADKCSKSDRTVQASIKSLCAAGHLTRDETPGKGCTYTVHPRSRCTPEAAAPPKRTTPTPEAASDKPSRTINAQKTSSSSPRPARKPNPFPRPTWADRRTWDDWLAVRKAKGQANTATAHTRFLGDIARISDDEWPPGRLLEHAVGKSWAGIYDPRERENRNDRRLVQRETGTPGIGRTEGAALDAKARLRAAMEHGGDRRPG